MNKTKYGILSSIVAIAAISALGTYQLDVVQSTMVHPAPPPISMSDMVETSAKFNTLSVANDREWISEPTYLPKDTALKTVTTNGEVIYAIYGDNSFEAHHTMIENIKDGILITYSTDGAPSPDWVELAQEKAKMYDHISVSTVDGVSVKLVEDINADDMYSVNKAFYRDGKNIVIVLSKDATIDEVEKVMRSIIQ